MKITPLYSRPDDLNPPVSSYLLHGGPRVVVVDPGPAWHLQMHMNEIVQAAEGGKSIAAVVQSPGPGAFSGLELLRGIGTRHVAVMHWKSSVIAGEDLHDWRIQSLTTKTAGLPVTRSATLAIGVSPYGSSPGSLMSYEKESGTLFTGPFLGSLGSGQETQKTGAAQGIGARVPRRHESNHAPRRGGTDLWTPSPHQSNRTHIR